MYILFIIFIIWMIVKAQNKNSRGSNTRQSSSQASARPNVRQTPRRKQTEPRRPASAATKRQPSAVPNTSAKSTAVLNQQASAVPNSSKKRKRTKEEAAMEIRTRASAKTCDYQAAYSKGKPKSIGGRGDYEPSTPRGMVRIRCAYCGAENFVPAGTHEHYHCYFCWEKL